MPSNEEIIFKLRALPKKLDHNQPMLEKAGMAFRTLVKERTQKGVDIHGQSFRPYSRQYLRIRRKLGRPADPVDLTIDDATGMIAKITHKVELSKGNVTAYISDSIKSRIGYYHAVSGAGVNRVKRQWWGLSDPQIERITKIINVDLDKILNSEI
nr:hypothetical protein 20 [Balneolaceae bacterium]